jgi:hypothetical protein
MGSTSPGRPRAASSRQPAVNTAAVSSRIFDAASRDVAWQFGFVSSRAATNSGGNAYALVVLAI